MHHEQIYFTIYFTPVEKKQKQKKQTHSKHKSWFKHPNSTFKTKNKIEIIPSGETLAERRRERW